TMTFFLMQAVPGGPFASERKLPPKIEQQMEEAYGLNDPVYVQYVDYLKNAAQGDFGPSYKYKGQSVTGIIKRSFPYPLILADEAIVLAVAVCIFLGLFGALYRNKFGYYAAIIFAVVGIPVPSCILAAVLQYVFASKVQVLPVAKF